MLVLKVRNSLFAAIGAIVAMGFASQAVADSVADFYKGKQVAVQVGFGAGGGMDTTARIWARHLSKYIPGNPSVIVQNVPGGGSAKLASKLYNATPNNACQPTSHSSMSQTGLLAKLIAMLHQPPTNVNMLSQHRP